MLAALLAVILPGVYWTQGPETVPALKRAGIEYLYVPAEQATRWRHAGLPVMLLDALSLSKLEKLTPPGVQWRVNVASATRLPWVDANGWRFQRRPEGHYLYELPAGAAPLAAAEAFAYHADAVLKIDPADLEPLGRMLAFLERVEAPPLPALANFGILDDGSPQLGEALNLLARHNLLFRVLSTPDPRLAFTIRPGTPPYPRDALRNPAAFVQKVRQQLGDDRRLLRIYGASTVLGRLTGEGSRARLHLLNYGGRPVAGMRVRVRGAYTSGTLQAAGIGSAALADFTRDADAAEFTIPEMNAYAVVDLR